VCRALPRALQSQLHAATQSIWEDALRQELAVLQLSQRSARAPLALRSSAGQAR